MAATSSTVPAVLDALVAAVAAALPGVQVIDGPPGVELAADTVMIGFTGVPGAAAVTEARTRQQYASSPDTESYDVACLVSSWPGGDTSTKDARDRAYALVDGMASAVTDRLGGLVKRARLSAATLVPEMTTDGAMATVTVTVHIDADTR